MYAMEKKTDKKTVNKFLRSLYNLGKDTGYVSTQQFLSIAKTTFKDNDFKFLKDYLTSKGWSEKMLHNLLSNLK